LEFRSADGSVVRTTFNGAGQEQETVSIGADGKTVSSRSKLTYGKAEESGKDRASRRSESGEGDPTETYYDEKGRAVREIRFGKDGKAVEETKTEWTGDRVSSVTRARGDTVRKAEYQYDSKGNRVSEKNYLNGRLERSVRKEGVMEIEELYKNGALLLRATYEGGVLVREERSSVPAPAGQL
jgi:flagellar hook assembly protein FlgD